MSESPAGSTGESQQPASRPSCAPRTISQDRLRLSGCASHRTTCVSGSGGWPGSMRWRCRWMPGNRLRTLHHGIRREAGGGVRCRRAGSVLLGKQAALPVDDHARWEYEIALKKIESQMLKAGMGSAPSHRNSSARSCGALLLAHSPAIRALMAEAAPSAGLDPDRLSFIRSINLVRRQVTDQAAPSPQASSKPGSPSARTLQEVSLAPGAV
jgi:hypothetical protein